MVGASVEKISKKSLKNAWELVRMRSAASRTRRQNRRFESQLRGCQPTASCTFFERLAPISLLVLIPLSVLIPLGVTNSLLACLDLLSRNRYEFILAWCYYLLCLCRRSDRAHSFKLLFEPTSTLVVAPERRLNCMLEAAESKLRGPRANNFLAYLHFG